MIRAPTDAVTELILKEEERLRRVARAITYCDADADDLLQDTMLRALRARARFRPGTSIGAWTKTILHHAWLTERMRAKRRRTYNDTDSGDALDLAAARRSTRLSGPLCYEQLLEQVDGALKSALRVVPPLYREPFLRAAMDGLSCDEIARELGVPAGTVMSRIHRARLRMRRVLVGRRECVEVGETSRAASPRRRTG